jgi:hypothetical protein
MIVVPFPEESCWLKMSLTALRGLLQNMAIAEPHKYGIGRRLHALPTGKSPSFANIPAVLAASRANELIFDFLLHGRVLKNRLCREQCATFSSRRSAAATMGKPFEAGIFHANQRRISLQHGLCAVVATLTPKVR